MKPLSKNWQTHITIIFLCISSISAQTNSIIDSLENELKKSKTHLEQSTIYYNIAKEYIYTDKEKCLENLEKAENLFKKINPKNDLFKRFYHTKAFYYRDYLNDYKTADSLLDLSIFYAKKHNINYLFHELNAEKGKAMLLFYTNKYEQSLSLFNKVIKKSKELDSTNIKNLRLQLSILANNAIVLANIGRLEEALNLFKKRLNLAKKTYNSSDILSVEGLVNSLNNVAICYGRLNQPTQSIQYYLQARDLAEQHNLEGINNINANLSSLFLEQEELDKAIEYATKAIDTINSRSNISAYINLGTAHLNLKNYKTSLDTYFKALKISKILNDKKRTAIINNSIAISYLELKKLDSALYYLDKTILLYEKVKNKSKFPGALKTKGEIFLLKKKLTLAKKYFLEAEKKYSKLEVIDRMQITNRDNLSNLYKTLGNYKESLKWLEKKVDLHNKYDSIMNTDLVKELETKYETEKKEKENLLLKQQNLEQAVISEKRKNYIILLTIGLGIIGLGLLLYIYLNKQLKKKNNIIKSQKNKIEDLQEDTKHRIKNNYNILTRFADVYESTFKNSEDVKNALKEQSSRIKAFSYIESLIDNEDTSTNFKEYLTKISKIIHSSFFRGTKIKLKTLIKPSISIPVKKWHSIALIINEFMTNSYKHAFPNKQEGEITVEVKKSGNYSEVIVKDNGVGIAKENNSKNQSSNGLRIMKGLASQIGGKFFFNGEDGTSLRIQFPS